MITQIQNGSVVWVHNHSGWLRARYKIMSMNGSEHGVFEPIHQEGLFIHESEIDIVSKNLIRLQRDLTN